MINMRLISTNHIYIVLNFSKCHLTHFLSAPLISITCWHLYFCILSDAFPLKFTRYIFHPHFVYILFTFCIFRLKRFFSYSLMLFISSNMFFFVSISYENPHRALLGEKIAWFNIFFYVDLGFTWNTSLRQMRAKNSHSSIGKIDTVQLGIPFNMPLNESDVDWDFCSLWKYCVCSGGIKSGQGRFCCQNSFHRVFVSLL